MTNSRRSFLDLQLCIQAMGKKESRQEITKSLDSKVLFSAPAMKINFNKQSPY